MLGRVAWRVQDLNRHISNDDLVSVLDRLTAPDPDRFMNTIRCADDLREVSATRDVVRMNVRVDYLRDTHPCVVAHLPIQVDILDRVDDDAQALASAAEEIRRGNGGCVQELTKHHDGLAVLVLAQSPTPLNVDASVRFVQ